MCEKSRSLCGEDTAGGRVDDVSIVQLVRNRYEYKNTTQKSSDKFKERQETPLFMTNLRTGFCPAS